MSNKCDWRLFSAAAKECMMCMDYEVCRAKIEQSNVQPVRRHIATDEIEEDAKQYADLIREMDQLDDYFNSDKIEQPMIQEDESEATEEDSEEFIETKGYKELKPIAEFLERENIPINYVPPDDLYVANFMMVSYYMGKVTVRTTASGGIPFSAKFIKKLFKGENKVTFKYTKRGTIEEMLPIIKSIVFYRKNRG
jgi:hypothetical protein